MPRLMSVERTIFGGTVRLVFDKDLSVPDVGRFVFQGAVPAGVEISIDMGEVGAFELTGVTGAVVSQMRNDVANRVASAPEIAPEGSPPGESVPPGDVPAEMSEDELTEWVHLQLEGAHVNPDPAVQTPHFRCTLEHTYTGWQGGKTVTVTAKQGCEGRVNTRFVTTPAVFDLAFARPGPNACDTIPGKPPVQNRTNVTITTAPTAGRCGGIWYDDQNPHCYDAEGIAVLATSSGTFFPFPGMRQFSLVLRVGTQVVQGGTNMSFTTTQTGPLEFCVNEPNPRKGVGGYEIHIRADEMGPPPPP